MSLNFFESNQIEQLIPSLCKQLQKSKSLPQQQRFIVSGFGIEQWLTQKVSHYQGVFANADFQFPHKFIQNLASLFNLPSTKIFTRDALFLRLYQLFYQECQKPQSQFLDADCWQYLQVTDTTILNRRLFELSLNFAQIFDEYQWQRPDWLQAWQSHDYEQPSNVPHNLKQTQQHIWQYLVQVFEKQYDTKSQQLYRIIALLKNIDKTNKQKLEKFAQQIHIFGLDAMQIPIWILCQALSEIIDINFYHFNPSQELWSEELFSPYYENKLQQKSQPSSTQADIDLFNLHHPLLMTLGQSGAGFQQLFFRHENKHETKLFINPIDSTNSKTKSLLHCCQQKILEDSKDSFTNLSPTSQDNSLSIHYCKDAQQELVQLRINLFKWLAENKEANLDDILIVAPNMQDYTAWIPTVFADTPHTFANTKNQPHSLIMRLQHFLTLLNSDFSLNDIKLFLNNATSIEQHQQTNQLNKLLRLYEEFGFRFGTNTQHRQKRGFDDERSLTQTIAKIWQTIFSSAYHNLPEWQQLTEANRKLLELSQQWQVTQQSKTLEQWLNQWKLWIQQLHRPKQPLKQYQTLNAIVDGLRETSQLCHFEQKINFQQMLQLWQYKILKPSVNLRYLDNKLLFSDMLPVCGIPKKFIAILGLNAHFPKKQFDTNLLNLSHYQSRRTDRNSNQQQRYQFLEYICATREVLWLSYSKVGQKIASSPILNVLQQYIKTAGTTLEEQYHPNLSKPIWCFNLTTQPIKTQQQFNAQKLNKKSFSNLLSVTNLSKQIADPLYTFYQQYQIYRPRIPEALADFYQAEPPPIGKFQLIPEIYRLLLCSPNMDSEQITKHLIQKQTINTDNYLAPRLLDEKLDNLIKEVKVQLKKTNFIANWQDPQQVLYKQLTGLSQNSVWLYNQKFLQHENQQLFIGYRFKAISVLHSWLYHLMTEDQQTTKLLYLNKGNQLKTLTFAPLEQNIKDECLQNILGYYHKLLQQPLLVFPQLLNHFLQQPSWSETLKQKDTFDNDSDWKKICNTQKAYNLAEKSEVHLALQEFKHQIFAEHFPEQTKN